MSVFEKYQQGKFVSGAEWTEDIDSAWQVTHDLDDGKAVDQLGFDGDHHYRKIIPETVLKPNEEHSLIVPPNQPRLFEVRQELQMHIDGARGLMPDPQSLNAGEL